MSRITPQATLATRLAICVHAEQRGCEVTYFIFQHDCTGLGSEDGLCSRAGETR